jgi:hypothetical protein
MLCFLYICLGVDASMDVLIDSIHALQHEVDFLLTLGEY